ncbi:DUF4328 domain-containing protein [Micromonospora sp. NPDC049366]|uniref:DUF4328 domain-containing protein n=1 Tax=Micromonospora sp. NPDC049366 TaxID=3364271 RepID=UPI0037995D70
MCAPTHVRGIIMRCQTCGDATSPTADDCQSCHTPVGQPAVTPGLPTYPVRGLGLAASIAVGATTVFFLLQYLFPVYARGLIEQAAADRDADRLFAVVLAEVALSVPFSIAILTAGVLVIIWTWRARKNTDAFPGALPATGAGWAIAGWLVPFANFVVPAVVVGGIARDSVRRSAGGLVGLWWIAWLVFSVGERVVSVKNELAAAALPESPSTAADFQAWVDAYQRQIGRGVVPAVACVVAAAAFIVLVTWISTGQQERIARAVPAWPVVPGMMMYPGGPGLPPQQSVTAPSPQVAADPTVASPPVAPPPGGTIGA